MAYLFLDLHEPLPLHYPSMINRGNYKGPFCPRAEAPPLALTGFNLHNSIIMYGMVALLDTRVDDKVKI